MPEGTEGPELRRGSGGEWPRVVGWLAWSLCALTVAAVAWIVAFTLITGTGPRDFTFLLGVLSSAVVGALVTSRRPGNPIGWFFVASAACFALSEGAFRYAVYGLIVKDGSLPLSRAMVWPQTWMWVPGIALVLLLVPLYFPNGRLLSPRWRPLLWLAVFLSVTTALLQAFMPGEVSDVPGVTNPLGLEALRSVAEIVEASLILFPIVVFLSVASLVVRFRRSRGVERQQMKWLTYTGAVMATLIVITSALDEGSALYAVMNSATGLVFAGIPVAVGVAVLRYRLYNIDLVINRTLVYAPLTIALIALYFGAVVALQRLFVAMTGQGSTLAIVASTLLIAALFAPLRRRIQSFIDRRFYRKKYDARRTLDAFSARLRDEADLSVLSEDLVGVVNETVQPSGISLWLRDSKGGPEGEGRAS